MPPSDLAAARRRLAFALDLADPVEALALAERLGDAVGVVKVGLELFTRGGPDVVRQLVARGREVFLDLKLHDIPATVTGAARAAAALGARWLTVHGPPSSVRAAAEAVASGGGSGLGLLGVTVLTSVTEAEQRDYGALAADVSLPALVARRARRLREAGCEGLVCSPQEVARLRAADAGAFLVTPGIRPAGADSGDQARVATPADAAAAGADLLVVGRPIRDAADPRAAADAIAAEIARGLQRRG